MTDVFTRAKRSEVMACVRAAGNRSTEIRLISLLRANRLSGWRRNQPVFGRPDMVFPAVTVAVFVDGCFWHGCPRHYTAPKHNAEFWRRKLDRNQARDRRVNRKLRRDGWSVIRIWEHELREDPARVVRRIRLALERRGYSPGPETQQ